MIECTFKCTRFEKKIKYYQSYKITTIFFPYFVSLFCCFSPIEEIREIEEKTGEKKLYEIYYRLLNSTVNQLIN